MINEALRLCRVYHDTTQVKFAKRLGISYPYLCQIESGDRKPSYKIIEKYSKVCSIPCSALLRYAEALETIKKTKKQDREKLVQFVRIITEEVRQ